MVVVLAAMPGQIDLQGGGFGFGCHYNSAWAVRLYYKPFVRWIWTGAVLRSRGAGAGEISVEGAGWQRKTSYPAYRVHPGPLSGVAIRFRD